MTLQVRFKDQDKISELLCQLDKFREKNMMADVTLKCDNVEIPAHRVVLSAGCIYFRAVFASSLDEKLEMQGMNPKGLETALQYIYSGVYPIEIENDSTALKSVLITADILQLPNLVSFCREHLVKNLNLENCLQILDVSIVTLQGDEMQKYAGINFDKLQYTKTFLELPINCLAKLITCAKSIQTPDVIVCGILRWVKHDINARKGDVMSLVDHVDVENLSDEYFHVLGTEPLVVDHCHDFFKCLYRTATTRLVRERSATFHPPETITCSSAESRLEVCAHVKLDFVNRVKSKLNYYVFTYYYADGLWSEMKNLTQVTPSEWFAFVGSGNFIYYIERAANDCKVLTKLHCDAVFSESLSFPYERYRLHSAVDLGSKIYMHISDKLVNCDLSGCNWQVVSDNVPNSTSSLLTCRECIWCMCWEAQVLLRYHPQTKSQTVYDVSRSLVTASCSLKCAPCDGVLFFHSDDKKDEKWNVYDCVTNEWQVVMLPDGIWQLGESWKLCNLKKELPCLFFVDNFNLLWEYYPKKNFWKRITDDVKFISDLVEVVVRV